MTPTEIQTERAHLIATRLAILNDDQPERPPTADQLAIANREADDWEAWWTKDRELV